MNIIHRIEKSSILVAISGGQDSLCLLQLFLNIQAKYNLHLGIIHIDHQWRNDTVSNTRHLINLMKQINIPLYIYQIKPNQYSELESRNLRYQILLKAAVKYKYDSIATAHTRNDQVETCLHNIIRGSTLEGLNSLIWNRQIDTKIRLIRPLLNFERWEITWVCRSFALPIWSDVSNLYCKTTRNCIRQELIPYMKYHLQNQLENQISNFLTYTSVDSEYIRQNTIKMYQSVKHPSFVAINYKLLRSQHLSLQVRVIHLFFLHNAHISLPNKLLDIIIDDIKLKCNINFFYSNINIKNHQKWLYFL